MNRNFRKRFNKFSDLTLAQEAKPPARPKPNRRKRPNQAGRRGQGRNRGRSGKGSRTRRPRPGGRKERS